MPSPFPGMDLYIEGPVHWSDFHSTFIQSVRECLNEQLPAEFCARIDALEFRPGPNWLDPVREPYIEIQRLPQCEVTTVVQVISHLDRTSAHDVYKQRRDRLLESGITLVELDLIRMGPRPFASERWPQSHYYCAIFPDVERPMAHLYPLSIRESLPILSIPLRGQSGAVRVDLGRAFDLAFERGRYDRFIDYTAPVPLPILSDDDAAWAKWIGASAPRRRGF